MGFWMEKCDLLRKKGKHEQWKANYCAIRKTPDYSGKKMITTNTWEYLKQTHQETEMEKPKKRVPQKNKSSSQNQILRQNPHRRDKCL